MSTPPELKERSERRGSHHLHLVAEDITKTFLKRVKVCLIFILFFSFLINLIQKEERHPRSARDKSATLRKMKATGTVRAALSPHKSPTKGEETPKSKDWF